MAMTDVEFRRIVADTFDKLLPDESPKRTKRGFRWSACTECDGRGYCTEDGFEGCHDGALYFRQSVASCRACYGFGGEWTNLRLRLRKKLRDAAWRAYRWL
jgi:hypothetical protein